MISLAGDGLAGAAAFLEVDFDFAICPIHRSTAPSVKRGDSMFAHPGR